MTMKEVQDFFEKMQHIVHAAYPEDKAEQFMSDMSEAFFKTYALETNKTGTFVQVVVKRLRVGQLVRLKNEECKFYILDIEGDKVFVQPESSRHTFWANVSEVIV